MGTSGIPLRYIHPCSTALLNDSPAWPRIVMTPYTSKQVCYNKNVSVFVERPGNVAMSAAINLVLCLLKTDRIQQFLFFAILLFARHVMQLF